MKIISWNVNGIRAAYRKGLMSFLKEQQPDIFCVQETKAHVDQVPTDLKDYPNGMFSYWSSAEKKGYSGVATFSLEEPQKIESQIGIKQFDNEGRFLITHHGMLNGGVLNKSVKEQIPGHFTLYNVYFPNGRRTQERQTYKMKFHKEFLNVLKKNIASGQEIIILGDYNIAPSEIDLYDPEKHCNVSGFLPEERAWFQDLLNLGFIDTFRYFFPEKKDCYTWWSLKEAARISNKGWRIDIICVTKGLIDRVIGVDILDQVQGSDHCPVAIEIEV